MTIAQFGPQSGAQLRAARLAKGMSRRMMAEKLKVHVSSVSAWESGSRLPREEQRVRLAWILGCDVAMLFPATLSDERAPVTATVVDTMDELPDILLDCLSRTKRRLRAFRFAAPYSTPAYVQVVWRAQVEKRLREATLSVERAEIVYGLDRLKEMLCNIIRYDGLPYYVKCFAAAPGEVAPFMGGYFFDDMEFFLGAYWTGVPPTQRPSLRCSGAPFTVYFNAFWNEIWHRGTFLNFRGRNDLNAVRELAQKLGLMPSEWPGFVEQARVLDIGDGAPPLF